MGRRRCAVRRDARPRCVDGGCGPKPCCACLPMRMFANSQELDVIGVDFDATELGLPKDQAPPHRPSHQRHVQNSAHHLRKHGGRSGSGSVINMYPDKVCATGCTLNFIFILVVDFISCFPVP